MHRILKKSVLAACLGMTLVPLFSLPACAQRVVAAPVQQAWVPDDQTVVDSYVYLLGRALAIRQEHTDLAEQGIDYNVIKYNPLASAEFVNPNFDVAYLEAWIAVDDNTPVILEVPKIEGLYYTAQILDEWGEVIANLNERTMPSHPAGKFAFVPPGSLAQIPADAVRIELHSAKAKLLGRVELKTDSARAKALQEQFKLQALGQPRIVKPVALPPISNKDLVGVELFDQAEPILRSASDVSPVAATMQVKTLAVAESVQTSQGRQRVQTLIAQQAIPKFRAFISTDGGLVRNNWITSLGIGHYGKDYWLRSAINFIGIWANTTDEAQYFMGMLDATGQRLNGSQGYVMHFPAADLPSKVVNGYWSVSMLSLPDYRAVPNELERYSLNPYSDLKFEADGSLKLYFSASPLPGMEKRNWLPAPAGQPFGLNFRTYVPKQQVTSGQWFPPAVQPYQ